MGDEVSHIAHYGRSALGALSDSAWIIVLKKITLLASGEGMLSTDLPLLYELTKAPKKGSSKHLERRFLLWDRLGKALLRQMGG